MQMNRFHRSLLFTVTKLPLFSLLLACQPAENNTKNSPPITPAVTTESTTEKPASTQPLKPLKAPVFLLKKPTETFAVPSRENATPTHFKTIQRRGEAGFFTIEKPGFMPLKP